MDLTIIPVPKTPGLLFVWRDYSPVPSPRDLGVRYNNTIITS
jgi:hypothetical protein